MESMFARDYPTMQSQNELSSARELGLAHNLKLPEVNTLIDYYKRRDPKNSGLLPHQFNEAAGEYMASELTIHPSIIFNIFDTGESGVDGRVTLREFILGYAILCRGTIQARLKYLFSKYDDIDGTGYLTRPQLLNCLTLMQTIIFEISPSATELSADEKEEQVKEIADKLLLHSQPDNNTISYAQFIENLQEDNLLTTWIENLSSTAGDHLKYIESLETDLAQLNMQRHGTIPLPRKQKLVRRDIKKFNASARTQSKSDDSSQELNAAKPFLINYDQIKFGKILGKGACATVYEGEWMHVPVAIKVFQDSSGNAASVQNLATNAEEDRKAIVGDYVEEFWLLLQIRHPNCLLYMGICFEPVVCIVTELFTGGSVSNYLHGPSPRKFSPKQAVEMISGVARAMFYLHASTPPILHRDLKASNILINQGMTHCVICDFGLSQQFVSDASGWASTEGRNANDPIGTPYTMAPEVIQEGKFTPASDVYAFGLVMYEMYTGRFPFPNMRPMQITFYVTQGNRPKFHDSDDIPTCIRSLIERCWAENPADRPNFEDILAILTSESLLNEVAARTSKSSKFGSSKTLEEDLEAEELSRRLLEAAFRGREDAIRLLIDMGARVNYADYDKRTPLHVAAAEGHVGCMRLLLSAGAELTYDRWNNSPIADASNFAMRTGNTEPIRFLRAIEGKTNRYASMMEHVPAFADSHQHNAYQVHSALYAAAIGDVKRMAELIKGGLDINCYDYDRRSPLCVAASEGRTEVVELLLRHGADVHHRDRWGSTAYYEAERGGFQDLIHMMRYSERQS